MKLRKLLSVVLAVAMLIGVMPALSVGAASSDDFASGTASTNWALTPGPNVTTGVVAGKSALTIRTGETAPEEVYAADFAVDYGANGQSVYEVDFSITAGTVFGIIACQNKIGTANSAQHFRTEISNDTLLVWENLQAEAKNTNVAVTPGVVHTLRAVCYSDTFGNKTEYYFDGAKVGETSGVAANPKWLRFRVGGANSEVKIYRVAKSIANNPNNNPYRYFCETFDGVADIAALEAKTISDVAGGDGWFITEFENGHTVTIEKEDEATNYLKMRRKGADTRNGSLTYTMPSGNSVPADLNITFMYDGAGQNEFRFTDAAGQWMCRMFTQDGQLYWGTSTDDYVGDVLKDWMAPFTEHTLTLRAGVGKIKIFLDDEYLGEKDPFTSGFGSNLPTTLRFYSLAKSITNATTAQRHLFTGLAIKSVTVDEDVEAPAIPGGGEGGDGGEGGEGGEGGNEPGGDIGGEEIEGDVLTSFTSDWTDAADDAWATTDDGENVYIGVKDGIEALVFRGGAGAVEHSCGGWYERAIGNAQPIITEFDFSVNNGGSFHARGYQDTVGGYNGFTAKGGSAMTFVSNGQYGLAANNPVIVTPDVVHTVRMEVVKENCTGGSYTQGVKYYLDGVLVYEETVGKGYNKFRLCAGKDSVVKIYEIREWGAISTWGSNKGVTTNFNGQTIDSLMASGRFTELGTFDPDNVSASVEKVNTSGSYLTMERVAGTQAAAANASVIYTVPATEQAEKYDLNIRFMYKGLGPVEMRFTDAGGDAWFTQMKIDDGKLYVASVANEWGEPVSDWITPYTEHTLTLSVIADGQNTKYAVYLDGVAVTGIKSTLNRGFGADLPASLKFYSLAQTVGAASTNQDLMNGILIKYITKDTDTIEKFDSYLNVSFVDGNGNDITEIEPTNVEKTIAVKINAKNSTSDAVVATPILAKYVDGILNKVVVGDALAIGSGDMVTEVAASLTDKIDGGASYEAFVFDSTSNISPVTETVKLTMTEADIDSMIEASMYQQDSWNLQRIAQAMEKAEEASVMNPIVIGAIGGSITEGAGITSDNDSDTEKEDNRYANRVADWWKEKYGAENVKVVNAGVGGTSSFLGAYRMNRHLMDFNPDFVVVDFAVNDNPVTGGEADDQHYTMYSYERIIHDILAADNDPAVMTAFFANRHSETATSGAKNAQGLQKDVAMHYGIPMVSILDALDAENGDTITYDDFFADTVHPSNYGHYVAAECINAVLDYVYENKDAILAEAEADPYVVPDFRETHPARYADGQVFVSSYNTYTADSSSQTLYSTDGLGELLMPVGLTQWKSDIAIDYLPSWSQQFGAGWASNRSYAVGETANGNRGAITFNIPAGYDNIVLMYRQLGHAMMGAVTVSVDGEVVEVLDGYKNGGWSLGLTDPIALGSADEAHTVTIKHLSVSEYPEYDIVTNGRTSDVGQAYCFYIPTIMASNGF